MSETTHRLARSARCGSWFGTYRCMLASGHAESHRALRPHQECLVWPRNRLFQRPIHSGASSEAHGDHNHEEIR
jgi:hypothetical protein